MTAKQRERFLKYAFGDDLDFYNEFTKFLPEEEKQSFFEKNPDFMSDSPARHRDMHSS